VQTALAFIDENGIDQLNMRALAARLSVQPMALYHYYSSKDSLLNGVAGLIDDTRPVKRTGNWRTDLLQVAYGQLLVATEHPKAAPLIFTRPATNEQSFIVREWLISTLVNEGLPLAEASVWIIAFIDFVNGVGHRTALRAITPLDPAIIPAEQTPLLMQMLENPPKRILSVDKGLEAILDAIQRDIDAIKA
jgi:AcrR family transcriptional regulator